MENMHNDVAVQRKLYRASDYTTSGWSLLVLRDERFFARGGRVEGFEALSDTGRWKVCKGSGTGNSRRTSS